MQERYTHILERWFITEPPLFSVLCLHELVQNAQMSCPLRSGRKKLEYNPDIVREMSDDGLEEALRALVERMVLGYRKVVTVMNELDLLKPVRSTSDKRG